MKEQMPMYSKEQAENEASRMQELVEQGEANDYSSAEKKVEREVAIKEISQLVEVARKKGLINNESANLVTHAISLEGDEAMFANRLISRPPVQVQIDIRHPKFVR